MTPFVEAGLLPLLFLTIVVLGAIRPGAEMTLAVPSLGSLVVAMVVFTIFVRSGALAPERLMNQGRTALANINGLTLMIAAYSASAVVISLVVPDYGVPALIVWAVLVSLLLQALAIGPDRVALLRGLVVTFGAAFVLKFVLLAAISAPATSRVARVLQLLFEGLTLGVVTQPPPHPVEGYLAFGTLVLYLFAVALLPAAPPLQGTPPGPQFNSRNAPDTLGAGVGGELPANIREGQVSE